MARKRQSHRRRWYGALGAFALAALNPSLAFSQVVAASVATDPTKLGTPRDAVARATVVEDAAIYLLPDRTRQPLRTAARGSLLEVVTNEDAWLQVRFQDPQFGLRVGYIESRFVRLPPPPNLQPMDLSVPSGEPRPQTVPVPGADATPQGRVSPVGQQRPELPPPTQTVVQQIQERNGFWFNIGAGWGSVGCDACGGVRLDGLSGGLSLGGALNDKWLIGVGTTGYARNIDGELFTLGTLDARFRFYPSLYQGFFLTFGGGVGSGSYAGGESEFGLGIVAGLGWDLRLSPNVSLTPFWNGVALRNSTDDANFGQLGLGITIH